MSDICTVNIQLLLASQH